MTSYKEALFCCVPSPVQAFSINLLVSFISETHHVAIQPVNGNDCWTSRAWHPLLPTPQGEEGPSGGFLLWRSTRLATNPWLSSSVCPGQKGTRHGIFLQKSHLLCTKQCQFPATHTPLRSCCTLNKVRFEPGWPPFQAHPLVLLSHYAILKK